MNEEALRKADRHLRRMLEDEPDDAPVEAVLVLEREESAAQAESRPRSDFETRAEWRKYLYEQTQQQAPDVQEELRDHGVYIHGEPLGEMLTVSGSVSGMRSVLEMSKVKAALLDRKITL